MKKTALKIDCGKDLARFQQKVDQLFGDFIKNNLKTKEKSPKKAEEEKPSDESSNQSFASNDIIEPASAEKKSKNKRKAKNKKNMPKDQDLSLLSEYAMTIKYSSDTQMCDINKNRARYKQRLYCAKQLMSQSKNIIVSTYGVHNNQSKDNCYAPVIYDQKSADEEEQKVSTGSQKSQTYFLSKIKYTLNNSDIPHIDKNHAVYCLCEIDNFVVTGHAHGYITVWETVNCGKRVINQYLPCIDVAAMQASPMYNIDSGNLGLQNGQYDITAIMQVNKTNASSYLIVTCLSGELQILKINGRTRRIELVHLITLWNQLDQQSRSKGSNQKPQRSSLHGLSKLGDGRFCVFSNQGFSIWQVSGLQNKNGKDFINNMIKLNQHSKQTYL